MYDDKAIYRVIFNVSTCHYIIASFTVTLEASMFSAHMSAQTIQHSQKHKIGLNVTHLFYQQISIKAKEHHEMDSSIFIFYAITLKQRYRYTVTAL